MLGLRLQWLLWALAMGGVLAALAFQARYAAATAECAADDRLVLCAGPLPAWLLPATVGAGLILIVLAARRLARAAN